MTKSRDLANLAGADAVVLSGTVIYHGSTSAPTGYLKANGAAISRSTYADLFAAIGTTFGAGDGSSTFTLPDLRGEFMRGWDDSRGVDGSRIFGSAQADELEAHTHLGRSPPGTRWLAGYSTYTGGGAWGSERDGNTLTAVSSSTGGAETRPRNIALLACIKY